ncbi:DUF6297 family protein [Actinomadura rugatobispora]|uniref:DUF6297 family protein n=1 Tax=Actinomadura rugatobispora TaxID=1994 RepID=A0ABW1A641_9ACTN|nr:hypothetical protein GCM10010200_048430 [Actinomadura rugatobispora]
MRTWTDRYSAAFAFATVAMLLLPMLGAVLSSLARPVDPSRVGAGVALVLLAYAGYLALVRRFGPVATSAADAAWRVLSPLPRRGVLRRTVGVLVAVALASGLILAVGGLSAVGVRDQFALRVLTAGVTGISATVGGMAVAVLAQASPAWDVWLLGVIVALVVLAVLAAVLGTGPPASLAGVPAAAVAAVLVRLAWAALERVPARSILDASTRAGRVVTAAFLVDPSALSWIAEDEHWRRRRLRSRPWPRRFPGALVLAWSDWRRLARRPGRWALLAAGVVLPVLTARAGGGITVVTVAVVAVGAFAAAAACTAGARRDVDDPSLVRLSGVGVRAALAARALLPALVGGAWLSLALTGLVVVGALGAGPWWLFGPAAAPALAAGALRMARRGPVDYSMPLVPIPGGAMVSAPMLWAVTGVDLAALGCVPVLSALWAQPHALGPSLVAQAVSGALVAAVFLLPRRSS